MLPLCILADGLQRTNHFQLRQRHFKRRDLLFRLPNFFFGDFDLSVDFVCRHVNIPPMAEIEDDEKRELHARYLGFIADVVKLEAKLAELDIQREETRKRLESTRRIAAELGAMCGVANANDLNTLGFTDAIRTVIGNAYPDWLSVKDMKDRLEQGGFDLSRYESPSASIYTILGRLEGKFVEKKTEGFNVLYRWIRPRRLSRRQARNVRREVTKRTSIGEIIANG